MADGICQLKITLRYVRPACWRRVLVPASATLGALHEIIQIAFAWDDDHLHAFTVGRRQYGDPGFDFEYDEEKITLAEVFARERRPVSYVYDLGDNWLHEITLEKTIEPDSGATYPSCVGGRGEHPSSCEDHTNGDTPSTQLGNYVSATMGNYVSGNSLNLGKSVSADSTPTGSVCSSWLESLSTTPPTTCGYRSSTASRSSAAIVDR